MIVGILLLGLALGPAAYAQSTPDSTNWVEVRLHHDLAVQSAQFTAERGTLAVVLPSGGAPILQLRPDEAVTLGRRQSDVYARHGESALYARSLHLVPSSEAAWTLKLAPGSTRTYTGSLRLSRADSGSGVQLVNRVPLSDYVASVVAGEYGLDDRAGTRAMAVVARTYALFSTKHFDGEYDHVDGTASQVYRGQTVVTDRARRAARTTRGEILTYDGAPIQAVYFSSSGGHTANNEDVWTGSDSIPYLRGKNDPYDRQSPKHRWSAQINRRALLQALTLQQGTSVEGFLLGERSPDGRLRTVEILRSDDTETEIEASTFRTIVNENMEDNPLKSTWFDARRAGSEYVFEGRGHGHGVGLNQWGAHAMAEQGKSYREILSFYYTGVQIQHLGDTSDPPPLAEDPAAEVPDSTATRIGW
jgi:stage II sporulation protein D